MLYDVLRLPARGQPLYTMVAVFPIPSALENTSGENEPCSIPDMFLIGGSFLSFVSPVTGSGWNFNRLVSMG